MVKEIFSRLFFKYPVGSPEWIESQDKETLKKFVAANRLKIKVEVVDSYGAEDELVPWESTAPVLVTYFLYDKHWYELSETESEGEIYRFAKKRGLKIRRKNPPEYGGPSAFFRYRGRLWGFVHRNCYIEI